MSYVKNSVDVLIKRFLRTPNVFLTEDDLRMQLCNLLLRYYGGIERTKDGDESISLHSEVRWYGEEKLRLRSDIVIIDVSSLNVLHPNKLPSKSYKFNNPKVIIELKLRRSKGISNKAFRIKIKKDFKKLNQLKGIFDNVWGEFQTEYWMIAFDKKERLECSFEVPAGIRFIYKYASKCAPISR